MADAHLPEGLTYIEEFVAADEEHALLDAIEGLDFRTLTMRGQTARRTVRMFGLDYDYEGGELVPADPLPDVLTPLRERAAALIERDPEDLVQILVSRYPAGAGIGWHRDAPMFGSKIVGVSLKGPSRMRFQQKARRCAPAARGCAPAAAGTAGQRPRCSEARRRPKAVLTK